MPRTCLRNSNGSWKSHLGYYSNLIKKHWMTYLVVRISRWLIHMLQIIYLKCNWYWLLLILMCLWGYLVICWYPHVIIWSIWPPLSNLLSEIIEITPNKFEIANRNQLFMCACYHVSRISFAVKSNNSVFRWKNMIVKHIESCLHTINVKFSINKTELYQVFLFSLRVLFDSFVPKGSHLKLVNFDYNSFMQTYIYI